MFKFKCEFKLKSREVTKPMSENTTKTPEATDGSPGASSAPAGAPGPAPAPSGSETPRKPAKRPRNRGVPAAPAAMAGVNTVASASAGAASALGPAAGFATAGALVAGAVALGARRRSQVRRNRIRQQRLNGTGRNGSGAGPGTRSGGSRGLTGGGTSGGGGGSKRSGPSKTGSGPSKTGSGSRWTSGSNRSGPRPGGPGGSRSGGSAGSTGHRSGGSGRHRTESPRTRRQDRAGNRSGSGGPGRTDRPRLLRSSPTRTSALRKTIGPRPGSGPASRQGGLIRRGDGSKRQPVKATRNAGRAVGHGARKVGRATVRAWNSRVGKAMRAAARKTWGVGWPASAAAWTLIGGLMRGRGWRKSWQAANAVWARLRTRWAKGSKHAKAAEAAKPPTPGDKVDKPSTLIGGSTTAAPAARGGIDMAQARFIDAAAEMLGAAMVYHPEGMMQVGNDFAKMPEAYRNIANAMKTMAQRAHDEDPLHAQITDQMFQVYQKLQEAAQLSEELGPMFRNLHNVDIARIEAPRRGEAKWDVSNNRS